MISYDFPHNQNTSSERNYTLASTLRKPKSYSFELLFGDYVEKRIKTRSEPDIIDAIDYVFEPGQIFGFGYKSLGAESKKIQQCFVLCALAPGQTGSRVLGISPGAKVLLKTLGTTASIRFRAILDRLQHSKINLAELSPDIFERLHHLIDAKINTDYFVNEVVANSKRHRIFY